MAETLNDVKADLYRAFTKAVTRLDSLAAHDGRFEGALNTVARLGEAVVQAEARLGERDDLGKPARLSGGPL